MSLQLDSRQRAMLQEMHVQVWSPMPAVHASVAASEPANAPTAERAVARPQAPAPDVRAVLTQDAIEPVGPGALAAPAGEVQALDWSALQQAVAHCRACALCEGRRHTVFGMGGLVAPTPDRPPVADWLIVGEAPGEQEDLRGLPFVGPAGQLLDNMLKAIGLDRLRQTAMGEGTAAQGCFIANVLKCRPPGNRNPDPSEAAQCTPFLQRQIELLQPKIILALGRVAAQSLLQDSVPDVHQLALGKLRGRVHRYRGIPVVVTYHPAYLLRALGDKAKAWADLCLALQVQRDAT